MEPYRFFFSYASETDRASGNYLEEFFNALCRRVALETGEPIADVGYRDKNRLTLASFWGKDLVNALQRSRVLICIISPHYLNSAACGREVEFFLRRFQLAGQVFGQAQHHRVIPIFWVGDVRSRAITWGKIADILFSRGKLDEALRIRMEEELPVYDRLGDVRSRAITLSRVADIFAEKENHERAYALYEESLDILKRLGDADNIAATLWGLIKLDITMQNFEAAAPRITEVYSIVLRLGRAEGIAVVGLTLGQFLAAADRREEALAVLHRSAEMFKKLGRASGAQEAEEIISQLALN
jgi:tetratricopeptide (TPR) repeat protein